MPGQGRLVCVNGPGVGLPLWGGGRAAESESSPRSPHSPRPNGINSPLPAPQPPPPSPNPLTPYLSSPLHTCQGAERVEKLSTRTGGRGAWDSGRPRSPIRLYLTTYWDRKKVQTTGRQVLPCSDLRGEQTWLSPTPHRPSWGSSPSQAFTDEAAGS